MSFSEFWQEVISYTHEINFWEFSGLIFGLLAVIFLIKESIWTWPFGIAYVVVSFVVFWDARLYGDFLLHIFFLALNVYGWHYWVYGKSKGRSDVPISKMGARPFAISLILSILGIFIFAQILIGIPFWFDEVEPASLPYWDSTTSMLSVTGMWLTARKKIDNWYYWLAVDVLAAGIYFYKDLYFYALLYFIYIGMAVSGYLAWKKTMLNTKIAL